MSRNVRHDTFHVGGNQPHPHQGATDIGLDGIFGRGMGFSHICGSGAVPDPPIWGKPIPRPRIPSSPMSVALGVGGVSFRRSSPDVISTILMAFKPLGKMIMVV
jgi:hypothetical protein